MNIFPYLLLLHILICVTYWNSGTFKNHWWSHLLNQEKMELWFIYLFTCYILTYAERKRSLFLFCSWWNAKMNIWTGWHIFKDLAYNKFLCTYQPLFTEEKAMNKTPFGKTRGERELQTPFTQIMLALVVTLALKVDTWLVFHHAGKIAELLD